MRVTIETVVDEPTTELFLQLYRASFDPLEARAAGRQALTDDEFRDEMDEPSVLKFVGWDRHERPIGLVMIATDLDVVPWISPAFWRERYPEHAQRNAILYYGAMLVRPEAQKGPTAYRLLVETVKYTARNRCVAAFDCCRHNVEDVELPRMIADVANKLAYTDTEQVDAQLYYGYVLHGLRDEMPDPRRPSEIDLREPVHDPNVHSTP